MMIVLPEMAKTDIGRGYDFFAADLRGAPFDTATMPKLVSATVPGQTTRFFAKLVEDSSEIAETLDISAQASFGSGAFSAHASADFSRGTSANSYSLFIVGRAEVKLEKTGYDAGELASLRLAPDILSWFKGPADLKRFRQAFGDQFVTGSVKGGSLNFIIQIETHSATDKAKLEVEIGGSGMCWNAQANFKATLDSMQQGRRVTTFIYQSGGSWDFTELTADRLFETLIAFPARIAAAPVIHSLEVQGYDSIQNWPAAIDNCPSLAGAASQLEVFQDWHARYDALINDIDYVEENLVAFEGDDGDALDSLLSEAKQENAKLVQGFMDFVSDPLDHPNLTPSNFARDPDQLRSSLPKWRVDLPTCAADILAMDPTTPDGDYDIWIGGDGAKRAKVFCRMGDTPREYLRLVNPNFSMRRADAPGNWEYPGWPGTDVVTTWEWIRIDPRTLEIDLNDFDGSKSRGGPTGGVVQVPFGSAGQCAGNDAEYGLAVIDIGGTGFAFHPSVTFGQVCSFKDTGKLMVPSTTTFASLAARGRCSAWGPMIGGVERLILVYTG